MMTYSKEKCIKIMQEKGVDFAIKYLENFTSNDSDVMLDLAKILSKQMEDCGRITELDEKIKNLFLLAYRLQNEEVVKNVETRSYWVIDQFGPRDQPFFLSNPESEDFYNSIMCHNHSDGMIFNKNLKLARQYYDKIVLKDPSDTIVLFSNMLYTSSTLEDYKQCYDFLAYYLDNKFNDELSYVFVCEALMLNKQKFKDITADSNSRIKLLKKLPKDIEKSNWGFYLSHNGSLHEILGDCYFYNNNQSEQILYCAYQEYNKAVDNNKKYYKQKPIREKQYLEGLLNISNNRPITDLLNELYKLYSETNAPHSIKRHLIIDECSKRVGILLGNSINKIDNGTYSNLQNCLTSFITEEILDMEEQQCRKNSCTKYKSIIENNTIEDTQLEKNYSDKSYLLLSGIERLVKNLLYVPFVHHLQKEAPNNASSQNFLTQLPTKIRGFSLDDFEEKFTIGTFTSLIGRTIDNNGQRIIPYEYVRWLKTLSTQSEDQIIDKVRKLTDDMAFIGNVIRNPILHGVFAKKWTCVFALDKIMLGDNPVVSNIVELSGNTCSNEIDVENEHVL